MILGVGLIALGLYGITICQGIFQTFIGPNPLPSEKSLEKLAAGVAWLLFFGPITLAGLAALWFSLRRLGALDRLAAWREERVAQDDALHPGENSNSSTTLAGAGNSHDDLEVLSVADVTRLTEKANRIAFFLGLSAGAFLVVVGVFGLTLVSSSPLRYSGTISFAIGSGTSILSGLAVLQRTLRKEDSAWLLPLRLFTHLVLRKWRISADDYKTRRPGNIR